MLFFLVRAVGGMELILDRAVGVMGRSGRRDVYRLIGL